MDSDARSAHRGRTIAITGGARGIGLAIAESLAAGGARVAIGSRSATDLASARARLDAAGPGPHLARVLDVRDAGSVEAFVEEAWGGLGPVDGVVAAAAIYGEIGPFLESSVDQWRDALDINLLGTVRTVQAFARRMVAAGRGGKIALFSGGGQNAIPNFAPYVTSKGALWRFVETVGAELSAHGIFVNAIAPGAVNTHFLDTLLAAGEAKVGADLWEKSLSQKAAGGTSPLKAARLAAFLLSDRSTGLYGRTLSALWDDFENLGDRAALEALSRADRFAFRRVVAADGATVAR